MMKAPWWTREQRIPDALERLRAARQIYARSPTHERKAAVVRAEAGLNDLLDLLHDAKPND